jgi:hypothetical protein
MHVSSPVRLEIVDWLDVKENNRNALSVPLKGVFPCTQKKEQLFPDGNNCSANEYKKTT